MNRILRRTEAEIRVTLFADGEAADAEAGSGSGSGSPAVAVTITRDSDGDAIVTDAPADAVEEMTGVYAFTLTPDLIPEVDILTATWTTGDGQSFETTVEVVGGFLCSLSAIAAALASGGISDPGADKRREAREWAEGLLEDACSVSFRPAYHRETAISRGRRKLILEMPFPRRILAAEGVSLDVVRTDKSGAILDTGWPRGEIDIVYEHGYPTTPETVRRAAVKLARLYLAADPSNYDERATRIDTERASYDFLVTAGVRGARTSIPEVNQVIEDHDHTPPAIR